VDIERSGQTFTRATASPVQVAQDLQRIVELQSGYGSYLGWWKKEYGSPSNLPRHWIPALILVFGGNMALNYLCERQDDIKAWANEGMETVHGFVVNWLWEPILGVLDTIRCKDQRIGLSSKEGLKSDLQVRWNPPPPWCKRCNTNTLVSIVFGTHGGTVCKGPLSTV
jgi:nuclear-control-of-ATPase protein 2